MPTILVLDHRKCRFHWSFRGWKRGDDRPVFGSRNTCRAPLRSEQWMQANARFASEVGPPETTGITWSTWNVAACPIL